MTRSSAGNLSFLNRNHPQLIFFRSAILFISNYRRYLATNCHTLTDYKKSLRPSKFVIFPNRPNTRITLLPFGDQAYCFDFFYVRISKINKRVICQYAISKIALIFYRSWASWTLDLRFPQRSLFKKVFVYIQAPVLKHGSLYLQKSSINLLKQPYLPLHLLYPSLTRTESLMSNCLTTTEY